MNKYINAALFIIIFLFISACVSKPNNNSSIDNSHAIVCEKHFSHSGELGFFLQKEIKERTITHNSVSLDGSPEISTVCNGIMGRSGSVIVIKERNKSSEKNLQKQSILVGK